MDGTFYDLSKLKFKAEVVRRTISKAGQGAANNINVDKAETCEFNIKLCPLYKR